MRFSIRLLRGFPPFWKKASMGSNRTEMELTDTGAGVLLAVFGSEISEKTNSTIRSFCARLEEENGNGKLEGVTEWVPAYCSVTVYYDPFVVSREILSEKLRSYADVSGGDTQRKAPVVHEVPVCYEDEYAPDMKNVVSHSGLSREEVIAAHSLPDYLVYMLGFLPGFVYLGGMDPRLDTPRLASPRTKIPAGSVAIGGAQTGIYPVDSPGGWQIIGKTPLTLFDPHRSPPVLFRAGDRIRFVSISAGRFRELEKKNDTPQRKSSGAGKYHHVYVAASGIQVQSGGIMTTVQDEGRTGYQKDGFCVSGAMDRLSYALANMIAGNPPGAAVLETTFSGPEIRFTLPADFVITGADQKPTLDGKSVPLYARIHAEEGSVLSLGMTAAGMRSYIAFTGGVLVPEILGSRSTSLKYHLGGFCGRGLQKGDELAIGAVGCHWNHVPVLPESARNGFIKLIETLQPVRPVKTPQDVLTVRVVKGPQYKQFSEKGIASFSDGVYTVSPESDRMGYRCTGPEVESVRGTDIISDGIVCGSVQIPASGKPIVMMADHQTAGGYAKIATVIEADIPLLAQSTPGTIVRFCFVSQEDAFAALREQELQLRMVQEALIDGGF
jgi:KipI family sensor histidine kinase inhibitor